MFAVTIIFLIVLSPIIWWYYLLRKHPELDTIPGPKPLPFLGNVNELGSNPQEFLQNLQRLVKKYGKMFKFYIGPQVKTLITDPDMVEGLFGSSILIEKSSAYDMVKPWLGDGILVTYGEKWRHRRKLITPSFHFKILDEFQRIFSRKADALLYKLEDYENKPSVDIHSKVNLYSLDVICETAMGVQINALKNQNTAYVSAVRDYLDIFTTRLFSAWKQFPTVFPLAKEYAKYKKAIQILHDFTNGVIRQRQNELKIAPIAKLDPADDGIRRKTALLDLLLTSKDEHNLSNEDIRAEIDTFMFEGHDTTTSAISFSLLALADNPDVQQRVYNEIMDVIGDENDITIHHLQDMKYLEMTVKEVLRVYPSVPYVERRIHLDATIGKQFFPKDSIIAIFIYGLMYDASSFPNPTKFDPERFTADNQAERHKFSYVPFSAGPRNCLGQRYALHETKTVICKTLKKYKLLPVDGFKPQLGMSAILQSYNGVQIRLERR